MRPQYPSTENWIQTETLKHDEPELKWSYGSTATNTRVTPSGQILNTSLSPLLTLTSYE